MNKGVGLLILLVGAATGYLIGNYDFGAGSGSVGHGEHVHDIRNITENIPSVALEVRGDNTKGYDAEISFTNFRLAPESVNDADVPGEGHAHIYIDGKKINRVYSNWYHLGKFEPGSYEVEVRLSANDHHELAVNDEIISATQLIFVQNGSNDMHTDDDHMHDEESHDHMPE